MTDLVKKYKLAEGNLSQVVQSAIRLRDLDDFADMAYSKQKMRQDFEAVAEGIIYFLNTNYRQSVISYVTKVADLVEKDSDMDLGNYEVELYRHMPSKLKDIRSMAIRSQLNPDDPVALLALHSYYEEFLNDKLFEGEHIAELIYYNSCPFTFFHDLEQTEGENPEPKELGPLGWVR